MLKTALQDRADCPANLELIKGWIAKCKTHPACAKKLLHVTDYVLPTRLVDVGEDINTGGGINDSIENPRPARLVLSKDVDPTAAYIALSHCWGDPSQIPKTFKATLESQQEKIETLSKTFQDALKMTRELGVRYIWIDSLCIVQDDKEDFEWECGMMDIVYSHAYLTLSALGSADGSGGLFIPRETTTEPVDTSIWREASEGPLRLRGWVLQEQQLSPRIVHFSKSRLLWECRTTVSFEDNQNMFWKGTLKSSRDATSIWRLLDGDPLKYRPTGDSSFRQRLCDLHTRWLLVIEDYSSRSLSHEADKLPAIAGLAAALKPYLNNDIYMTGIWRNDIKRGLLWYRSPVSSHEEIDDETGLRSCITCIPSWSWASIKGQIKFIFSSHDYRPMDDWPPLMPSSHHVDTLTDDAWIDHNAHATSRFAQFGSAAYLHLRISCHVKMFHLMRDSGPDSETLCLHDPETGKQITAHMFPDVTWSSLMRAACIRDPAASKDAVDIYCADISRTQVSHGRKLSKNDDQSHLTNRGAAGLLLLHISGSEYQRVGAFVMMSSFRATHAEIIIR